MIRIRQPSTHHIIDSANQPTNYAATNNQIARPEAAELRMQKNTFYLCQNFLDLQRKPVDSHVSGK
jgi:hypothetical protein